MKLIIDAQISPAIAAWINRTFDDIQAVSARSIALQFAKDSEIYAYTENSESWKLCCFKCFDMSFWSMSRQVIHRLQVKPKLR